MSEVEPSDLRRRALEIVSHPTDDGKTAGMLDAATDEIERLRKACHKPISPDDERK